MIQRIPSGPRDEERDKSGQINEGHLAIALADQTSAMDDKERHRAQRLPSRKLTI